MAAKTYSGVDSLPEGRASDDITEGCILLEGGAFRGVYTSGVLDSLMQEGINMSCTVGISAGSLNGVNYVAGQIGRSARINLRYRLDGRYVGLKAFARNKGVIGFDFVFGPMDHVEPLDTERFMDPGRKFYAEVTNCLTGEAMFKEKSETSDILQAVRASSSMPYISAKVMVDGVPCLDGGCAYKVPLDWPIEQGYKKIVVVRTRERGWRSDGRQNRMPYRFYRKYKEFADVLAGSNARHDEICQRMEDMHDAGDIFVIWPSEHVTVSRLEKDMEKLGALYWLGYNDAKAQLPALKEYLAK